MQGPRHAANRVASGTRGRWSRVGAAASPCRVARSPAIRQSGSAGFRQRFATVWTSAYKAAQGPQRPRGPARPREEEFVMTLLEGIADRIAAIRFADLPAEAVHWAKVGILDT